MKRVICRVISFLCVLSLIAGLFIAYAEMDASKETGEKGIPPIDYAFYLSMESEGVVDLATPREKMGSDNYAHYLLSTITNTSTYPIYINVRDQSGYNKVGFAYTINSGTSTPLQFDVYYRSGYGNVGTKYRPSGQTSSYSQVGAYVEGEWHP